MATIESLVRTDYKAVDKRDEVRTVYGWLRGDSSKVPIVVDVDRPFGIVNDRALMSRRLDERAKLETYTLSTRALRFDATLEHAIERMREFRAAHLPVEDARGQLVGYVTAIDVARASASGKTAADLCMPVRTLDEKHTLGEAVHVFAQEYVDFLPVTNGGQKVTGVLPRRAILEMELSIGGSKGRRDAGGERIHILKDAVSGFMDEAPVTIPAAASFHELLDTIEENGYAIVQKKDGALLGMVTPESLLRAGGASGPRRPGQNV